VYPVHAIAGVVPPSRTDRWRTRRMSSYPFSRGIPTSEIIRSGCHATSVVRASLALPRARTRAPRTSRASASKSRVFGSSSTINSLRFTVGCGAGMATFSG